MEEKEYNDKIISDASKAAGEIILAAMQVLDIKNHLHSTSVFYCEAANWQFEIKMDRI